MKIAAVDAIPLRMSFLPDVSPHMLRATTHRTALTLYRVTLDNGVEGYGDDVGTPRESRDWIGLDAVAALRRDGHSGLQMACFDAVGKSLGVPAHALMGRQVRDR